MKFSPRYYIKYVMQALNYLHREVSKGLIRLYLYQMLDWYNKNNSLNDMYACIIHNDDLHE